MKQYTELEKKELLWEELSNWMCVNDYNGALGFAFNNNFQLHALSIWQNSGASQYPFYISIDRDEELEEIKSMCSYADIFVCEHCNHESFFSPDEIKEDTTLCESCHKTMKVQSRGSF